MGKIVRVMVPGDRYGDLTVIREGRGRYNSRYERLRTVVCSCKCGRVVEPDVKNVLSGGTKSCGCSRTERIRELARARPWQVSPIDVGDASTL